MQSYVITIMDEPKSVESAQRCIKSAKRRGVNVEMWPAITPKDDPVKIFKDKGLSIRRFENSPYSRPVNAMSAFLSHRSLWEKCLADKRETMILEHDAYFTDSIKMPLFYDKIISLGKPSYGNYRNPAQFGENPLTSKAYFPGAHAYVMSPSGAKDALHTSLTWSMPTDLFFNIELFPNLMELYPWPVEVRETFSTIQEEQGCLAKHQYNEDYQIL